MTGRWLRKPEGDTAVVFVHGILSSAEKCWRHDNGTYWPDLLTREKGFENLGVYVFTYRSDIFSGSYRLGDAIDSLKEHLRLDEVTKSTRIIFVCHSMGGIVVRQFLLVQQAELLEQNILIGLFLVASPSLGSNYANWLSLLAKAVGNAQADALRFHQNNAWLNDLDKNFINLKETGKLQINGKELIEDNFLSRGTFFNLFAKIWRKQIVEYFSGARYFPDSYKVPYSDHETIAKPSNNEAVQHRLLCRFIHDILAQVPIAQGAEDAQDYEAEPPLLKTLDFPGEAVEVGEQAALLGKDIFFTGPEGSGKTTALNAFLSKSAELGKKTVLFNLLEYRGELQGGSDLWLGIGESIYDKFKGNPRLEAPGDIEQPRELTRYLFDKVLRIIYPLVIAFDEVGCLRHKPVEVPFYTMIRVWRERDNNLYSEQTRLRIGLCGLERLQEFPVDDEDDKGSRSIHVEDIRVSRKDP